MNDDIDDMINQFNKQTARLKELREKKPEIGMYRSSIPCITVFDNTIFRSWSSTGRISW